MQTKNKITLSTIFLSSIFNLIMLFLPQITTAMTIRFATEATYPPFEYFSAAGKMQGFDVDIVHALCHELGATCTIAHQPFDSLIPSLKLGKFDAIIGAIAITEARKKQVDFTSPYYFNSVSFVAAKNSSFNSAKQNIQGKIIGVQSGTTFEHYLRATYGNSIKINTYASEQDPLLDLKSGRIDAALGDTPLMQQWLQQSGNENYQLVGKPITLQKYFGNGNGIAVKKGNQKLLQVLNKALAKIKTNGAYNKIAIKYFG
jgi:arginine transport system substrate-binding protein